MTRCVGTIMLVVVLAAGVSQAQTSQATRRGSTPVAVCQLQDRRITEASGIVASRRNPGCYYVHNDSGGRPRVFLVDRTGRTRLAIGLRHAAAVDCEDIALAPGAEPGRFDVCVADIGDNRAGRPYVVIYRFPEPDLKQIAGTATAVKPAAYRLRYADGPANAEGFFVHPRSGDGYILTKRMDGRTAVYKLAAPWNPERETVLNKLLELELPATASVARVVTGADVSPDGRRVAVRSYVDGWEWRLESGTDDLKFETVFQTKPVRLRLAAEPQGEALCYAADGRAILTVSEGISPTLYESPAEDVASAPSQTAPHP